MKVLAPQDFFGTPEYDVESSSKNATTVADSHSESYMLQTAAEAAFVTEDELLACIREINEASALEEPLEERMPLSFNLADVWAKLEPCLPSSCRLSSTDSATAKRPLEGKCIVYGGSLFPNSLPPLVSLARMGARLYVADCLHGGDNFKEQLGAHVRLFRLPRESESLVRSLERELDRGEGPIVCIDNGALLRKFMSGHERLLRHAVFVEGTAKGDAEFWDYKEPTAGFLSMNSTPIKLPEAAMGTPDGFVRHLSSRAVRERLDANGYPDFSLEGRHLVVIGAGKVGLGCAMLARRRWVGQHALKLTVLEKDPVHRERARRALIGDGDAPSVTVAAGSDADTLADILASDEPGNCIICTCTGVAGLLSRFFRGAIGTLEERRPLIVNMGFDDECGELVPASLDPLGLRSPPLPINWVYATADEPPTRDCIWDSIAAGLAMGGIYAHACYAEDAVGSHEHIVAPVVLSGCLLSEFLKRLPGAFQNEVKQIYSCFPEIETSLARYNEISGASSSEEDIDNSSTVLRLHKLDRNIFGHVSTISIYDTIPGRFDLHELVAFIQERVCNIVEMNPWLTGKLVRDLQSDELVLKIPGNDKPSMRVLVHTKKAHAQFDPDEVDIDCLLKIAATAGAIVDDTPGADLFRVSLLEMGSDRVGLVVSMNHKLADGHTCYRVQEMLHGESTAISKMVSARNLDFAKNSAVDSPGFVKGLGGDRHTRVLEIDENGIAKLKEEFRSAPREKEFISSNDVLGWLLSEAVGAEMCCTLMNMRGRTPGIEGNMAGNYVGAASFVHQNGGKRLESKFSPCSWGDRVVAAIKKAQNGHYHSLGDAVEKFPETSPDCEANAPVLVVNDWASLCAYHQGLPGCALVGHFPLFELVWNPGCLALSFRKRQNVLALCVSTRSEGILKSVCQKLGDAGVLTSSSSGRSGSIHEIAESKGDASVLTSSSSGCFGSIREIAESKSARAA